ncbi:MAG: efflux RND transporter periplasmic adaptor subunit [Thermoanaerobaculia bacterium]
MAEPPADRSLRGRVVAGVAALVLLLVLAVAALRRPEGVAASTAKAARADLVVPILADGTLESAEGGELRAPGRATVSAIRAREGERVDRGAVLVELENAALSTAARDARAASSELESERAAAAAELATAEAETARAKKTFEADGRLLAQGAITRSAYEADEHALSAASERLRAARARLDSLTGSRLPLSADSARALSRRAEKLTVRAPADGVVYNLPRKVGEAVEEGQVVASVANPDRLRVRVRVDQPDLPRVLPGQRLVVTFDGLPERRWAGRVTQVSPGLREAGGRQVGEVLGEIADPTSELPPNASVNVQVVVAEKKSALVVPRAALQRDGEKRFVWLLADGRARRREVAVGLVAPNEVEITSGLQEGETALLAGAVPFSEGLRVAAR